MLTTRDDIAENDFNLNISSMWNPRFPSFLPGMTGTDQNIQNSPKTVEILIIL